MPDQHVIDHFFRAEIQRSIRPLFIEFVLVNSHAPFNEQPRFIAEWSKIGDGSIYHPHKPLEFPVIWPHLENASEAYVTSVEYDFKVLIEFFVKMIDDNAFIIVLGDHQPIHPQRLSPGADSFPAAVACRHREPAVEPAGGVQSLMRSNYSVSENKRKPGRLLRQTAKPARSRRITKKRIGPQEKQFVKHQLHS